MESIYSNLGNDVIVQYASLLNDWMPHNATIAIAIESDYIYYDHKIIDIGIRDGHKVVESSIAHAVYESARKIEKVVHSPFNNTDYRGIGYPIKIQDKKGALIVILPATNEVCSKPLQFVTGRNEDEWQPIPIEEVSFFESLNKKNWCYQQQQPFQISLTMKDLANRLPENFIRIHRSYIINIRNISKITRDFASNLCIVMKCGQQLPVSQSYVANVRKTLEF